MKPFYITGGTMSANAESYVQRETDTELVDRLFAGEYCFVVSPRQTGKSSSMVRVAIELTERGASVAVVDLTKVVSYQITEIELYSELLWRIGEFLGLESDVELFLRNNKHLAPAQIWFQAMDKVILPRTQELADSRGTNNKLVIFIDEIDMIAQLEYRGNILASIRGCSNSRTTDPGYNRLTFCLLGAASPRDLASNCRVTPYNIGLQIVLQDLEEAKAMRLSVGLNRDDTTNQKLMRRIFHWTDGHPYLTQRVCSIVENDISINSVGEVDDCCSSLIGTASPNFNESNLSNVANLVTGDSEQRLALLALYIRVLVGLPVRNSSEPRTLTALKEIGLVKSRGRRVVVRNRIYRKAFGIRWAIASMLPSEKKEALSKALVRVLLLFTISLIMSGLIKNSQLKSKGEMDAKKLQKSSDNRLARLRADSALVVAEQEWEDGSGAEASRCLADETCPIETSFAKSYLQSLMSRRSTILVSTNMLHVVTSHSGSLVAVCDHSNHINVVDAITHKRQPGFVGHTGPVNWVAFSLNDNLLASASEDRTVRIWDVKSCQRIFTFESGAVAKKGFRCVEFSPFGNRTLVMSDADGVIWTGKIGGSGKPQNTGIQVTECSGLAFSSDGSLMAVVGFENVGYIRIYRLNDHLWTPVKDIVGPGCHLYSPVFSNNQRTLAVGLSTGSVAQVDIGRSKFTQLNGRFRQLVSSVAFSHSGTLLAAGSYDGESRIWSTTGGMGSPTRIKGNGSPVNCLAFTSDDSKLEGAVGNDLEEWCVADAMASDVRWANSAVSSVAAASDSGMVAAASGDQVYLFDYRHPGTLIRQWNASVGPISSLAFTSDGKSLVVGGASNAIVAWKINPLTLTDLYACPETDITITQCAYSNDGKWIVGSARHSRPELLDSLYIWDVGSGLPARHFIGTRSRITAVRFLPNTGGVAAATDKDGIIVWNLARGKMVGQYNVMSPILSMAASPDGKCIAVGCQDKSVSIWDLANDKQTNEAYSQPLAKFLCLAGYPNTCAYTNDNQYIAVGGSTGAIKVWDVGRIQEDAPDRLPPQIVLNLSIGRSGIRALAFPPSSRFLAAGGDAGFVRIWRADNDVMN